jgi:hypothetical protein
LKKRSKKASNSFPQETRLSEDKLHGEKSVLTRTARNMAASDLKRFEVDLDIIASEVLE